MTEQEAIKILATQRVFVNGSNAKVEAIDIAISALEKQMESVWIPCSERLPEYTADYNVTVGIGSILGYFEEVRTYRYEICNSKNPYRKWIIPNNVDEVINIIAWQPLPEPYKAGDLK